MFVVDYFSAFLLAGAFTVAFAGALRAANYHAWRHVPAGIWLLAAGSWIVGMVLVGLCAMLAHWVSFVLGAIALGVILFALVRAAGFKGSVHAQTGEPGHDARPAIAVYFCVTLLLFFCAISVRFYIVHLS